MAQEQSSHVYLSVLLHNMTESKGMIIRDAIVVQVLDAAFDVLVPEYGLEKRVYVDQLPLERHAWNESSETLRLYWGTDAFKTPSEEEEPENNTKANQNKRLSALPASLGAAHIDSMDHPDDATNAYDDERGLFDDESDYEDEDRRSNEGQGEDEDEDVEGVNDEAQRLTRIRIFGHVQVLITADTTISPPVIKVIAMNPYASTDADTNAAPVGAFAPGVEA